VAKKPLSHTLILLKVAAKLKHLRKEGGYKSYEAFALDNELDRKQYWRIENGQNLTLKTLVTILNKHKISLEDFFKGIK
jgi:hypothetical protein